jgi:hypothetical protein
VELRRLSGVPSPELVPSEGVHELFRLDPVLPVAPGESPFRVRGLYYDRFLAHLKTQPGGLRAVLDKVEDPRVVAFIQQPFTWLGWYDVLPLMPLCIAIAGGRDFEKEVAERTYRAAFDVIPSLFRLALRLPGPAAFAAQTATITAMTMEFVRLDLKEFTDTHSSGWGRGIPLYIAPHWASTVIGFFRAALEMRYSVPVRARYTHVEREGTRDGFETVAIRFEFEW